MQSNHYSLNISETLSNAWDKVYGVKKTFWAMFAIFFVIATVLGIVGMTISYLVYGPMTTPGPHGMVDDIFQIFIDIVFFLMQMSLVYVGIQRAKDAPIHYGQLFYAFNLGIILRMIGVYILQTFILFPIAIAGFIIMLTSPLFAPDQAGNIKLTAGPHTTIEYLIPLILIPLLTIAFVYMTIRLYNSLLFVLDQKANPWSAIKMSYYSTQGNVFRILVIMLTLLCAVIVSVLTLGIGLIWVMPFSLITYGTVYKNLLNNLKQ